VTLKALDLATELEEREATLTIHGGGAEWVVWLYAADDPGAAFFQASGDDLGQVLTQVFNDWDGEGSDAP
jgi:hypothetical protein